MKRALAALLSLWTALAILSGCASQGEEPKTMVYYTYFDTVSYIYSYAPDSQTEFEANCALVSDILEEYHRLFDIYHEYEGLVNLATVNAHAGGAGLAVDEKLVTFLQEAKDLYGRTDGKMNVMLGSVLKLWHDCRDAAEKDPEDAAIPSPSALQAAAAHTDIDDLEIDAANSTVRIADPEASLDVGAVAKGYAVQRAAEALKSAGVSGYVLNIGGNIRSIGTKPDGSGWTTGVRDPADPAQFAAKVLLSEGSCVTSGRY